MLTPADRSQLRKIETQLAAQDPAFAARMRTPERLPPFPVVTVLCFGFYVVWPFIALLAGPTAAFIAALAFGTLVTALFVHRLARPPGC
jgi:Protein of unknown function (DUF3040)